MSTRLSFSFAMDGTHAACLSGAGGPLSVERWAFTGSTADRRVLPTRHGETSWTQVLGVAGGRVLFTRPGNGNHQLVLAEPTATGLAERTLVTIDDPAVRLVATPAGGTVAVAVSRNGDRSTIWRILPAGPWRERLVELPGMLAGGSWLDGRGAILGLTRHLDGTSQPIAVDLRAGRTRPIAGTSPGQHVLLSAPRSGLLLLAETTADGWRLGHRVPGATPRFPDVLDAVAGSMAPIAVDPTGRHVALRVNRGTRSQLMIFTPGRNRLREIEIPAGVMQGNGSWSGHGLRFAFSSPTQPTGIATVNVATGRWRLDAEEAGPGWVDAQVREFAGGIEAVVYGDPGTAEHLLVSLHGGPQAATRLDFDPLAQAFARAGIAVVAPNYRGSIGYGLAHQRAIQNAWGGPDLADIRCLARELARDGRRLTVYGTSYGAFLALLAASADPGLWSQCVAVSPFLSGPRLHEAGSPAVRALIDRLGGRAAIDDDLGPRDLTRLCERITARLLIVHGGNDDVIPVGQSRELRQCLLRAGRVEERDFTYLESPTGGHDPMGGPLGRALTNHLIQFLRAPRGGEQHDGN